MIEIPEQQQDDDDVPVIKGSSKSKSWLDNIPIIGTAKKKLDTFLAGHIDELAQKKPGLLNPNPEQNPALLKSFLPEAQHQPNESLLANAAKGVYNQVARPMASPAGLYTAGMGEPYKEPIPNLGMLEKKLPTPDLEPPAPLQINSQAKSGTPIYNTPQFGLNLDRPNLPYPLSVVPNRMRPPSTNATVFDALVPERYKVNEQGAARPLTTALDKPSAVYGEAGNEPITNAASNVERPTVSQPTNRAAQETPLPKNDIDKVAEQVAIPKPGDATVSKDISRTRAEFGSVDKTLLSRPETAPIADTIVKANDQKLSWIAQTERKFAEITQGLNTKFRRELGQVLDGKVESDNPVINQKAAEARQLLDEIYAQIPGGSKRSGENTNYLTDYLTHIESEPGDFQSAVKKILDFHGVPSATAKLFERGPLGEVSGKLGDIFEKGKGTPSSNFAETRIGFLHNVQYDTNKVFPAYIESIAKVIFDKPAVNAAKDMIEAVPDSRLKELAGWYVKNYTNYEATPGLTEAWNTWSGKISRMTSRSMLGFSPHLQTLHAARIFGNLWPELPTKYLASGLKQIATNPIESWTEAAKLGMLQNEVRPWSFKTPMQKVDSVIHLMSAVDAIDRAAGYHGFKQMFLSQGMNETEAATKALGASKNASLVVDPARTAKFFAPDSDVLGGSLGQLAKQFKQIPVKIIEQYAQIANNAKNDPKAAARLAGGLGIIVPAAAAGMHTFHISPRSLVNFSGAAGTEAYKIGSLLLKGNLTDALKETALWITPAGKSVAYQLAAPKQPAAVRYPSIRPPRPNF